MFPECSLGVDSSSKPTSIQEASLYSSICAVNLKEKSRLIRLARCFSYFVGTRAEYQSISTEDDQLNRIYQQVLTNKNVDISTVKSSNNSIIRVHKMSSRVCIKCFCIQELRVQ